MAATLLLDRLIENTYLDFSADFKRACRCAVVTDIDLQATGFDPNVMVKALAVAGMPQLNDSHPSIADCRVVRHLIRGQANNQATVQIFYETPTGGDVVTGTFYTKAGTALQTESSGIDFSGRPLYVNYTPTGGTAVKKHAPISRLTPLRTIQINGTISGLPDSAKSQAVGCVNSVFWQGLGVGFWLCNGFEFEYLPNGTFSITSSFISRVQRDWKEYSIFLDETGNVPDDVITNSHVPAVINAPYAVDQFFAGGVGGFSAVGFYPLANFSAIFGF